jgi:predicted amidohydrolase YtcJ
VTHEYVIAVNGRILGTADPGAVPTAIAWAADRILAVGPDDRVRAMSRGDSTFIDLAGSTVTVAPADPAAADAAVRAAEAAGGTVDMLDALARAGVTDPGVQLEPGAPADLAVWGAEPAAGPADRQVGLRIVALVRAGRFTEGDEHRGPFAVAPRAAGEAGGAGADAG